MTDLKKQLEELERQKQQLEKQLVSQKEKLKEAKQEKRKTLEIKFKETFEENQAELNNLRNKLKVFVNDTIDKQTALMEDIRDFCDKKGIVCPGTVALATRKFRYMSVEAWELSDEYPDMNIGSIVNDRDLMCEEAQCANWYSSNCYF